MAGRTGEVYWMETLQSAWTTSSYYTKELPAWVADYNRRQVNHDYMQKRWTLLLPYDDYRNSQVSYIEGLQSKSGKTHRFHRPPRGGHAHKRRLRTDAIHPAGNSAMLAFAKQIVTQNAMGTDARPTC